MPSLVDSEVHAVMQRFADAWAAGDVPALNDCDHAGVVFHYFGRNPYAGTHRGKAACIPERARHALGPGRDNRSNPLRGHPRGPHATPPFQ
jgi:hypothetical protein